MKKVLFLFTAILLCLTMTACSAQNPADSTADTSVTAAAQDPTDESADTAETDDTQDTADGDTTEDSTEDAAADESDAAEAAQITATAAEELFELVGQSYTENGDAGVTFDFVFRNLSESEYESVTFDVRMLDANGDPVASNFMMNAETVAAGAELAYTLDHNVFSSYPTVSDFAAEFTSIEIHRVTITPDCDNAENYYQLPFTEPIVIAVSDIAAE